MDQGSAGELLKRICTWAERQLDIRALVLTGSHARGQADDLSDLDLEFFTRAPERYVQSDRWMADIGTVGVYLPLQNDRGLPTRLVIFDNGLKADFTICPVAALNPRSKKVLEDALHECRRLRHRAMRPQHLLLGLLLAGGIAGEVLASLGVSLERIRETLKAA